MRRKIALIGGGQIGQILAMIAAQKELGDIVILDIPELENPAKGKALDLMEMAPHGNYDAHITGTSDYKDIAGADVVIVTAGRPRQAGMTREDLLAVNLQIITAVAKGVKEHAPKAFCIIVTNPLDAMVYAFYKLTGFPKNQVVGMAGALDTAQLRQGELRIDVFLEAKPIHTTHDFHAHARITRQSSLVEQSGAAPGATHPRRIAAHGVLADPLHKGVVLGDGTHGRVGDGRARAQHEDRGVRHGNRLHAALVVKGYRLLMLVDVAVL